jgi:hypothetical protein
MERLAPLLRPDGYGLKADGETLLRQADAGWSEISVYVAESWPPHYDFYLDGRQENWAISDLYGRDQRPPKHPPGTTAGRGRRARSASSTTTAGSSAGRRS